MPAAQCLQQPMLCQLQQHTIHDCLRADRPSHVLRPATESSSNHTLLHTPKHLASNIPHTLRVRYMLGPSFESRRRLCMSDSSSSFANNLFRPNGRNFVHTQLLELDNSITKFEPHPSIRCTTTKPPRHKTSLEHLQHTTHAILSHSEGRNVPQLISRHHSL